MASTKSVAHRKVFAPSKFQLALKRITDVITSIVLLFLLGPLFLIVAVAIKVDSRGPALFKQDRVGMDGRLFKIIKFRTMRVDAPNVATDELLRMGINPITRVGAVLRRTSIDELPQLFNVLLGDMSLVGPRPALFNQYELTQQRERAGVLEMRPGITGWAQINGRDELEDDVKVAYDKEYCETWSYLLDWIILWKTAFEVLGGRGVN